MTTEHYTKEQAVQMARECGAEPDGFESTQYVITQAGINSLVNLAAEKAVAEYKKYAERRRFGC